MSKDFNDQHLANILRYAYQIDQAYERVIDQFAKMALDPSVKFSKSFSFSQSKKLSSMADKYVSQLSSEIEDIVTKGIKNEWSLSNSKNNALIQQHITKAEILSKVSAVASAGYNLQAIEQFAARQIKGLDLSNRIWKISESFRMEMEVHLGLGIMNGDSAQVISRRTRQYLKEPDKLFRRIRNKNGKLVPSARMKEFKPGQGVYKSSYMNARRVAVTETNTAYLSADHERWNETEFVVGVRITLSKRHPCKDICDSLKGDYPKEFKFTGWHPQCLCTATPILLSDEEFEVYEDAILAGEEYTPTQSKNHVGDVPPQFKSWVNENRSRGKDWKSTPHFIKDNLDDNWLFKKAK